MPARGMASNRQLAINRQLAVGRIVASNRQYVDGGGGGGADLIVTAALPAPGAADTTSIYRLTLDNKLYFTDGSTWFSTGISPSMTAPVSGDFAWVNQTSASVTATIAATNGGILLSSALATSGLNNRLRVKSAPAVPYVITAAFMAEFDPYGANAGARVFEIGLVFRQSSDGKFQSFVFSYSKDPNSTLLMSRKWTNPTSFSADYINFTTSSLPLIFQQPVWMRIADDNTNRICSISSDGVNFFDFDSRTRADFLTADQVGFVIRNDATSGSRGVAAMNLLSWAQS